MMQRLRHAFNGWLPQPPTGTRIDFQVSAPLAHGQTLYIVGDIPALGGSVNCVPNPAAASTSGGSSSGTTSSAAMEAGLALVTTPDYYPIWYNLEAVVVPVGTVIRYRYAVCSGARFMRYENIHAPAREIVVGIEDICTQDTLDSLALVPADAWGVVPRLSSGQAFVDRRASGDSDGASSSGYGSGSGGGSGGIGNGLNNASSSSSSGWGLRRTSKKLTQSISESIPEEGGDVEMKEADATETNDLQTAGAIHRGFHGADRDAGLMPPQFHHQLQRNQSAPAAVQLDDDASRLLCPNRARSFSDESIKSPQNMTIESTDGVIIVVYRLPVLVQRSADGVYTVEWEDDNLVCPSGLLKETSSASHWDRTSAMRITWVGTVHCSSVIPKEDEERLARQLEEFHCVPVFLSQTLGDTFHSFCYGTLWPIFHNLVGVYGRLPTRWWNPNQQKNAWSSYKNVNRIFVNKVIEVYNEGDLVWVHGLHLLVAPSFLSRRLPNVNVGLFVHTPFPSSEIFRTLSVRADLLRGMLSADHIGFHLYEHARHFLTSCRRILGLTYSPQPGGYIGIEYNGRMVMLTISHIGIETSFMDLINQSEAVIKDSQTLKETFEADKQTVIVSVDRVERLKGILLKLAAVEQFALQYPEYQDKIQLIQVGLVDSSNPSEEKTALYTEIADAVKRINERFAAGRTLPLVAYSEVENTDMASRLPLWKLGDVYLTTSVRDAINLYPFEFVYAHELATRPGVVIVSEFSGSSRVLTGSIGINPWKREEIVKGLLLAMTMPEEERLARHRKDLEYIRHNSRTQWAQRILVDLKRTKTYATDGEYMGYGLGLGFRKLEFNSGFTILDTEAVAKAYRTSFRRVLLFDYGSTLTQDESKKNDFSKYLGAEQSANEGTLVSRAETPAASPELLSALSLLCADPRNTVFVLSGRERADLEKTLGSVKGLGLAAEHGYLYKWGDSKSSEDEDFWMCTKDNFDDSWKDVTHSVMDIYTQRTHGTYVELKGSSMLWQFRDADPEFGQVQAKELHDQLKQVLEFFQVEVITGNDYLEVRPQGVDKGVIVDRVLSTLESSGSGYVDFVLCVGDDQSDECMFKILTENQRARQKIFSVTVGKKPSAAQYYVNDVDQVMEVMHSLTKVSTAANRNLSLNDLRLLDQGAGRVGRSDFLGDLRVQPPPLSYGSDISFEPTTNRPPQSPFNNCVTPTAADMATRFSETGTLGTGESLGGRGSLGGLGSDGGGGLGGGLGGGMRSKHSMSMSALSSVTQHSFPTTSATYEQYFNNIGESENEDDPGGIFF